MALVRFDLERDMDDLRREVNRVFGALPGMSPFDIGMGATQRWLPAMDTVEEDGELKIALDVPGMTQQDIDVEVVGDLLMIRGERRIERSNDQQQWHRFERATGSFERVVQMPDQIDPESVHATFDNGVLTVTMPAVSKTIASGKRIEITAGD